MARKDIPDALVCKAYIESIHVRGPDNWQWPADILMAWTRESYKVCESAMQRAYKRGYIEYGVSLRAGWLTDSGNALIKDIRI